MNMRFMTGPRVCESNNNAIYANPKRRFFKFTPLVEAWCTLRERPFYLGVGLYVLNCIAAFILSANSPEFDINKCRTTKEYIEMYPWTVPLTISLLATFGVLFLSDLPFQKKKQSAGKQNPSTNTNDKQR